MNQLADALLVIGQGGIIYGNGGGLTALFSNANVKWTFPANAAISGSPAIAQDGTVYFAARGALATAIVGATDWVGTLYAVSADGKEKWQAKVGGRDFTSPTIATDGTIYIGSDDKNLYAIYGASGLADAAWPTYRKDNRHTAAFVNPPLLQTELALAMYPGLTIKGNIGTSHRIEFSTDVSDPKTWQSLATVTLDRTPFFFVDVNVWLLLVALNKITCY